MGIQITEHRIPVNRFLQGADVHAGNGRGGIAAWENDFRAGQAKSKCGLWRDEDLGAFKHVLSNEDQRNAEGGYQEGGLDADILPGDAAEANDWFDVFAGNAGADARDGAGLW
jgi:hypothetical protein